MFKTTSVFALASLASIINAQSSPVSVWAQCGGIGWAGSTTCVSGTTCTFLNACFSQCIPSASITSSASATSSPTPTSSPPVSSAANFWFSFGDSYTQTAFSPSGNPPQIGQPLGNPPYPGGTTTVGPNWIDFYTVMFNNSLILTWNYAYGGATIDASLAPPFTPTVLSLTDQVNEFLSGTATKPVVASWTSENALFSIWIGINDLTWSWWPTGDRLAYNDVLLDADFALVEELSIDSLPHSMQNHTDFVSSPSPGLGLDPSETNETAPILQSVIEDFNTKLAVRASNLSSTLAGVQTFLWDSYAAFNQILDDPSAFGFVNITMFGSAPGLF
ncbi:hypothetical protein BDP27DRAFT_1233189 [Rhodocollybia butyracea]|uniref:CBM1 domain-containing protein n=1 Tax=Rhodocollybia butyracea TaxID=206335 RepID=A0A9P5PG06_9AGAR|nr:hypothetical protein BDP27DRAFT_1233189 [Rhodocollybia butyracea]